MPHTRVEQGLARPALARFRDDLTVAGDGRAGGAQYLHCVTLELRVQLERRRREQRARAVRGEQDERRVERPRELRGEGDRIERAW